MTFLKLLLHIYREEKFYESISYDEPFIAQPLQANLTPQVLTNLPDPSNNRYRCKPIPSAQKLLPVYLV